MLARVGAGGAPDAAVYGDEGADTLGHMFREIPELELPHLISLGLANVLRMEGRKARASYDRIRERSAGKDSTTGIGNWRA